MKHIDAFHSSFTESGHVRGRGFPVNYVRSIANRVRVPPPRLIARHRSVFRPDLTLQWRPWQNYILYGGIDWTVKIENRGFFFFFALLYVLLIELYLYLIVVELYLYLIELYLAFAGINRVVEVKSWEFPVEIWSNRSDVFLGIFFDKVLHHLIINIILLWYLWNIIFLLNASKQKKIP